MYRFDIINLISEHKNITRNNDVKVRKPYPKGYVVSVCKTSCHNPTVRISWTEYITNEKSLSKCRKNKKFIDGLKKQRHNSVLGIIIKGVTQGRN